MARDGYRLTNAGEGVAFDLGCSGIPEDLAWTEPGSDDGWLALDRDGNGTIDNGSELFGNVTDQPPPPQDQHKNGFLALRVFDQASEGGNANGHIDAGDAVYSKLRIWQDLNHDGITGPGELKTLVEADIGRIELFYRISERVDEHGNAFYYAARVYDLQGVQRGMVWDVYLTSR